MDSEQFPLAVLKLMYQLLQQSNSDYQFTSQALIDGLTDENEKLRAELSLIRQGIIYILEGPYMPMPSYIRKLLYPSLNEIKARIEEHKRIIS